ncbi:hypothetical protein [Brevibacterium casei]|uniref:hypothetical protein n=1 Tax=Brevibacterium casei TaxID=33889 RepID=UPI0028B156D4|nr:hypothetical protein [Brevibacterium casei]
MDTNNQSETIGARRTREILKLKRIVDMLARDYRDPLNDLEVVRLAEIQLETIRIAIVDQASKVHEYPWPRIARTLGITEHEARRTYGPYRPISDIPSILREL